MAGVLVAVSVLVGSSLAFAAAEVKVEAVSGNINLAISMSKDVYLESEPIVVRATLVNKSEEARRLADPEWCSTVEYEILSMPEEKILPVREMDTRVPLPADFGTDFEPGGSMFEDKNLQLTDWHLVPPGDYAVRATYTVPRHLSVAWHGQLATPLLRFAIKEAPYHLKIIAGTFCAWPSSIGSAAAARELAELHLQIANPEVGGPYADFAVFFAALAYKQAKAGDEYLKCLRDYAKSHSEVPYFGACALRLLADELVSRKDYAAARETLMQIPDSRHKRIRLRLIEEETRKVSPQQPSAHH